MTSGFADEQHTPFQVLSQMSQSASTQPDYFDLVKIDATYTMTYAENLWLFSTLLLGVILLPGVDMIFVLANSLTRGREVGLAATGGLIVGGVVHSLYGALGVGLLTHLVPLLFAPMAFAGGVYIAWIGVTLIRSSIKVGDVHRVDIASNADAFRRGVITCLLNPKAYIFMLAIYPQFLKPELGPLIPQALIMATILAVMQLVVYGGLAFAAGHASRLAGKSIITVWMGRACGIVLIAVAVYTLWQGFAS